MGGSAACDFGESGTPGGISKGGKGSGVGGEGKWPVRGFRGDLPVPSLAGDSHCPVKQLPQGWWQPRAQPQWFLFSLPAAVTPAVPSDRPGQTALLQRSKPSPPQPSSSHCHEPPVPPVGAAQLMGPLCLWDGKGEPGRVSLCPNPPPCLSGGAQACSSPWVLKANSCLVCPARFAVLSLISARAPDLPWHWGSPTAPRQLGGVRG